MPLYEYLCESCGERSEILQRFGNLPEVACPSCGGAMRRLPSAPSFQFKGSGFYQTDYVRQPGGTEESSPRGEADKGAEKSVDTSGDKSSDKSGDSGRGKGDSPSAAPGAGRDSAASPAESAPATAAAATPAAPAKNKKKPASSGGE